MWVCTPVGFISIVEDKNTGWLKIRARKREHLEALFHGLPITESAHTDYRFRVFATRDQVAHVVASAIMGQGPAAVTYPNFKDSVRDHRLHDLYADFWSLHYRYQHEEPKTWPKLKGTLPKDPGPLHDSRNPNNRIRARASRK